MTGIDMSTTVPPSPERTLKLAKTMAEIARALNHATRHHEALRYPSEADRLIREISSAASRLPQLLGQVGKWLEAEDAAGRITVAGGEHDGSPSSAVAAVTAWLHGASITAAELQDTLVLAASVTSHLGAAEVPGDGSDDT